MNFDLQDMKQLAINKQNTPKLIHERFSIPIKTGGYSLRKDRNGLSPPQRQRVEELKERKNCHYDDDYNDPFFK
jgi:hypothetical protein